MAYYHVEVGYRFKSPKRMGVSLGMTVKAFDPEEAEEIAREYALDGKKARIWAFSNTREATESDIAVGVIND